MLSSPDVIKGVINSTFVPSTEKINVLLPSRDNNMINVLTDRNVRPTSGRSDILV